MSATNLRFRNSTDDRVLITEMNWRDNPWFPDILNRARLRDLAERPEQYDHIWEGDYVTIWAGAYFAASLSQAKLDNRIGRIAADPIMQLRAIWDIGGAGKKADHTAIWIAQFVGREIRVLDHYEAQGQPLAAHVEWLRSKGYSKALCILPHDGANQGPIVAGSFADHLRQAEFAVQVIPNQGTGAAMIRVNTVRRLFPRIWINEATCEGGLEALAAYHAKKDEQRGIDLGPEHDWASHSADAFGLMCSAYEEPVANDDDDADNWRHEHEVGLGGY